MGDSAFKMPALPSASLPQDIALLLEMGVVDVVVPEPERAVVEEGEVSVAVGAVDGEKKREENQDLEMEDGEIQEEEGGREKKEDESSE
jgi:hypothetical protein